MDIDVWKFPKAVQRNMVRVFSEIPVEERHFQKRRWAVLYQVDVETIDMTPKNWTHLLTSF